GGQVVPPGVAGALQSAPALGVVAADYSGQAPVNGVRAEVGAIGRAALGVSVRPAMISGSLAAIGLGTVGVGSGQLAKLGAHQGGTLVIRAPSGPSDWLRVGAVYDSAGPNLPGVLMSVIERTRESALMRALGLTRGQLRRMLLTEALLMAALAIVLGAGLGVTFGVVMVDAFVRSTDGQGLLSIPYSHIALYAAIAV